ncbi:Importin-7 [Geodia barretti]|uniref:Importin-7 n=1 Tax=Geodia barretti TaxID=519541 RepID=A0AA35WUA8_GEOBA|nr:Importin-7 [Geodia barretti]
MVFKQVSLVERSSLCKKRPLSEVPPCHDNSLTLPAALSQQDPEWYSLLTSRLSPEQTVQVQEFLAIADKRVAARQSRAIEQQGGYQFNISVVPNTFAFGAEGPPSNSFGGQS